MVSRLPSVVSLKGVSLFQETWDSLMVGWMSCTEMGQTVEGGGMDMGIKTKVPHVITLSPVDWVITIACKWSSTRHYTVCCTGYALFPIVFLLLL